MARNLQLMRLVRHQTHPRTARPGLRRPRAEQSRTKRDRGDHAVSGTRWRWIVHEGARLYDVGLNADGSLHNPGGYPEQTVRDAIAAAQDYRHRRPQTA